MPEYHISPELLDTALGVLGSWSSQVVKQRSRHVWSLLPVKVRGAMPGGRAITYAEQNDHDFMKRFLAVRDDLDYPFFDPFTREWLPTGYFHSNMATMRKNRFARQWGACQWDGQTLSLNTDYANIFVDRVLTKGGEVTRIPAIACAVWFFKRPSGEWRRDPDLTAGVPSNPSDIVDAFRKKFNFEHDGGWPAIFDDDPALIPNYTEMLRVSP
jgi:hypothetical protein